jgi:mRNA-degrading endonuclease RelE of RelBE toxin-antitoxin system
MPSEVSRRAEFDKDLKRLTKRFRTLEEDLDVFIGTGLLLFHQKPKEHDYGGIVQITDLKFNSPQIYKVRKFASRSLKGRGVQSGIRITYAYFEEQDKVEFIEIYFKGDKENEDRERINRLYGSKRES